MTTTSSNYFKFSLSSQNVVGKDAHTVFAKIKNIKEKQQELASSVIGSLKDEVLEIFYDCSEEGWDGYGAAPVSRDMIRETLKFIDLLPQNISMPEVIPEPSGEIGFIWQKSSSHILSLTITPQGEVSYVFISGKNEEYGHLQFFDELPETISKFLKLVDSV